MKGINMKYKNYINNFSKDNRIYTKSDIANMTVKDAFNRKPEIIAQNRQIGIPTEYQMQNSSNVIWVEPYIKEDGTSVKGHWRAKPGTGSISSEQNFSEKDFSNPLTENSYLLNEKNNNFTQDIYDEDNSPFSDIVNIGLLIAETLFPKSEIIQVVKACSPIITKLLSNVGTEDELDTDSRNTQTNDTQQAEYESKENDSILSLKTKQELTSLKNHKIGSTTGGAANTESIVDVSTPEKVQKLMYPDEIAGVKRGKEKTLHDIALREVNSDYNPEIENNGYNINCQSSVFAADLQARGYDVEACSGDTLLAKELAKDISFGYIDPTTGNECSPDVIWLDDGILCSDYIEKNFPNNSRGMLCYQTKINDSDFDNNKAHVIMVGKDELGNIVAFDTQNNDYHEGEDAKFFLGEWINKDVVSDDTLVTILRVDNKIPNPKYLKSIIRPHR